MISLQIQLIISYTLHQQHLHHTQDQSPWWLFSARSWCQTPTWCRVQTPHHPARECWRYQWYPPPGARSASCIPTWPTCPPGHSQCSWCSRMSVPGLTKIPMTAEIISIITRMMHSTWCSADTMAHHYSCTLAIFIRRLCGVWKIQTFTDCTPLNMSYDNSYPHPHPVLQCARSRPTSGSNLVKLIRCVRCMV